MELIIPTVKKREVIDITNQVEAKITGSGMATVFVAHTTAAITAADLDTGTDTDILNAIAAMTPAKNWRHPHDPSHFPDHLWATLIGPSISVPFWHSKLQLGTWQRIILLEFDGPRERKITVTTVRT